MKQKLITALRTKYQRFGLSSEAIDRIASAKEKTVTSEDDIETAIADVGTMELIATELQKSADVERRKGSDLQKSFDEYKEKHPETKPEPQDTKTEESDAEKALREKLEKIEARFAAEDKAKADAETVKQVEAKLKESISASAFNKGVFNSTIKGFVLGKDENVDSAVERLKGEYDANLKETFGDGPIPGMGGQAFGDTKSAVEHKNDFLKKQGLLK